MKLTSVAVKPLGQPLFPIERFEKTTRMMGGEGILQQSNKNYCREHQMNLVLFFVGILAYHLMMGWNNIALGFHLCAFLPTIGKILCDKML